LIKGIHKDFFIHLKGGGSMNRLKEVRKYGQSIWLDYIRRDILVNGELKRLVEEDGVSGVTSNPTIFEKAINGSNDYDNALITILKAVPGIDTPIIFEQLAIQDIQMASDILRPVFEETGGIDGYVSMEVSPHLAHDTENTISEVERLWKAIDRPNLMIKVPATPEGVPAIEVLISEGININVTLMFSLVHYNAVSEAYISGLERCSDPSRVASVASFFVSRVDTAVDREMEDLGTDRALALRGKIAIANAKVTYQRFHEVFSSELFSVLQQKGARFQRVLWGSTGTKNPAYSDVYYVEELMGPDTVNTVPPATMDAFRDHGRARDTLDKGADEAEEAIRELEDLGIDLDVVTDKLQVQGVAAFAESYDKLLDALDAKCRTIRVEKQI
jgi:transaldolase